MKSKEHEQITKGIVKSIFEQVEGARAQGVNGGKSNLWPGASDYKHQVDVSVQGTRDILLVECKSWGRKVSAESVLTFAARVCDIRRSLPKEMNLHAALVTTKGVQPGAETLAKYFNIGLDNVSSASEFVFKYKHAISAAVADSFTFKDETRVEVGRADSTSKRNE